MLFTKYKRKLFTGLCFLSLIVFQACNKEFEDIPAEPQPAPTSGLSINEIINTDTSYSFFKALVGKAGYGSILGNNNLRLTVLAPNNNAFRASGIPTAAVIDTATSRAIVSYNVIPEVLTAEGLPTGFPNFQYPTFLNPAPALSPFLRLSSFPSKRSNGAWINNIPLLPTNTAASNGIIHNPVALVAPPSKTLYELVVTDPELSFLKAALERADSGRTTIAEVSLIEISKSIGANLTVFAPTNDAFRAAGFPVEAAFGMLPVETVRGLLVYHVLPVRAFSVNMPSTATNVPTLLNSGIANHPGVNLLATFTGPFVTDLKVRGVANTDPATVTVKDIHAVNGVLHKINQVLKPQ